MKTPAAHVQKDYTPFEQQAARTAAAVLSGLDWDEVDRQLVAKKKHRDSLVKTRPTRS